MLSIKRIFRDYQDTTMIVLPDPPRRTCRDQPRLKGAETLLRRPHPFVLVNDTAEAITAQKASMMAWRSRQLVVAAPVASATAHAGVDDRCNDR